MRHSLVLVLALLVTVPAFALAQVPTLGHVPLAPGVPAPQQLVAPGDEVVEIVRDAWGVAHVYADTPYALGFGNGYAQAQDRLFQIDVLRHVSKGDSASVIGASQLASDVEVRRELYTDAERQAEYEQLPAEHKALFDGFAAGVNRFIDEAHADPLRMPAEFPALAHAVEPWTATDTLAIAQFLLDTFGSAGGQELANAALLAHLRTTLGDAEGRAAFDDLVWRTHPLAEPAIPADEGVYPTFPATMDWNAIPAEQREVALAAADAVPFGMGESLTSVLQQKYKFKFGSNAVIVGPEKSASGGGLLGGGPQMGYYSPMVPYEVGLHGAGFDVVGIGVGGAPGIVIGRTATFSWTVTSGIDDQVDVVGVRLVAGNPRQYHYDGGVRDMDCRIELHVVRAPPPTSESGLLAHAENDVLRQEACRTVHGPVFAMNEDAGWAFARERSHRLKEVESGIRWLTIGQGETLGDFRASLSDFAFTFNFHYVDAGNMYYQHVGYQPVRDARLDPRLPRPGSGDYEWSGVLTGDALPRTLNPEQGWIVNWNNLPQKGWAGAGDSREQWGSVHRVDLLKEQLKEKFHASQTVTLEDVQDAVEEAGTRDPFARRTVPQLLEATSGDASLAAARAALTAWKHADYTWAADAASTYEPAHAVYDEWRTLVQERVFADELGAFIRPINFDPPTSDDPHGGDHAQHGNKDALLLDALEGRTAHAWCDNVTTPAAESCNAVLAGALADAVDALAAEYNTTNVAEWRMDEHRIRFISLSAGPAFEFPMMNRASFNHKHDWGTAGSPASGSVLPPGTGAGYYPPLILLDYVGRGNLPPHARDQLDLYVAWEYKPMNFNRAEAEAGGHVITMHTMVPNTAATPPPTPSP